MGEETPVSEAIRNLSAAISNALLYAPDHPTVLVHSAAAAAILARLAAAEGETGLVLVDDSLFHEGIPVPETLFARRLVRAMKCRGLGYMVFLRGVGRDDILQTAAILSDRGHREPDLVRFGRVELQSWGGEGAEEIASFEAIPKEHMESLGRTFESIRRREKLTLSGIGAVVGGFLNSFRNAGNPLLALAPLRSMDEYSFAHSVNVGILNIAQAMSLGMEDRLVYEAGLAGTLHDVGKMFVRKELLLKKGELTRDEWDEMKQHPVRGAEYLLNQPGIPRAAILAAYEHHLRHDGSGYPKTRIGRKPHLVSEMTMISDCFDAVRTRRLYQEPSDFPKAAGILVKFAGERLHRGLTYNFLRVMNRLGAEGGRWEWTPPASTETSLPADC